MEDRMCMTSIIHTGVRAAAACDDINAKSFTDGNHVASNRGEYDASSDVTDNI